MATASEVIETARSVLGRPYVWGAEGPDAFDCSGLIQWAFGEHGITLPRVSAQQAQYGTRVDPGQRRAGDLIFTSWDADPDVDHVALLTSRDEFIHAPQPGQPVQVGHITPAYLSKVTNVQRVPALIGNIGGGPEATTTRIDLPGPDLVGAVRSVGDAVGKVAQGVSGVGVLAEKLLWFALPSTWVRITTGFLGAGFILIGLKFLVEEAR